jgi:hypothetical protein
MKNSLQVLLTNSEICLYKHGAFVKKFGFEKSGIPKDNIKLKIDFLYKVLKSIVHNDKSIVIMVFPDCSYIDYSEHAEIQIKGKETKLESLIGSQNCLISAEHKYFINKHILRNLNSIKDGVEYYELLSLYKWKQELIDYLYMPLSIIHNNLYLSHVHEIYNKSDIENQQNLLIDLSSKHTDISIYRNAKLIKATRINAGIDNLICLIAEKFAIPLDTAKQLFQSYGMLIAPNKYTNFVIDIPLNEFIVREVPVPEISNIIQKFFAKLFNAISLEITGRLKDISVLTLTGEAHKLIGLDKFTGLRFNCEVNTISKTDCLVNAVKQFKYKNINNVIQPSEKRSEVPELVEKSSDKTPISLKLKQFVLNFISDVELDADKIIA